MPTPPVTNIYSVYTVMSNNSISLLILITNQNKKNVETLALIDSGAGGKFINQKYAEQQKFPVQNLEKLIMPRNVDGTINKSGAITTYVNIPLTVDGRTLDTRLLVTELGNQKVILGYPWLQEHNLDINWQTGRFRWQTHRPLKVKRYHEGPMQRAETLVKLELDRMEHLIQSVKVNTCLEVKLHSKDAHLPTRGSPDAAGYDLYSAKDKIIPSQGKTLIDTQISIATPPGTYG